MSPGDPRLGIEHFVVPGSKITDYLLDLQHPDGGSKAAFFLARGFHRASPEHLEYALVEHGRSGDLIRINDRDDGQYVTIMGGVMTPLNRTIHIVSVWAVRFEDPTRALLVTAYPGKG